jgi:hypothetical protein
MVRLLPARDNSDFGLNFAERDVYRALAEQLPATTTVVHDYSYASFLDGRFKDGQSDFIVIIPGIGTCFLEVKGTRRFKYIDGRWHRYEGDRAVKIDDPFKQACQTKHDVVDLLQAHLNWDIFPGKYAHVVVYPRGILVDDQMPASTDRRLLITKPELSQLGERIVMAIQSATTQPVPKLSGPAAEKLIAALTTGGDLVPLLTEDLDADAAGIECLTRDQKRAWSSITEARRVIVVGPAGSGKTLLARQRAQQEHERTDGRVLFTCFNKSLAAWLRATDPAFATDWLRIGEEGVAKGIHVIHFHELCSRYINSVAGRGAEWKALYTKHGATEFFRRVAPVLLDEVVSSLGCEWKFDSIVVDEGQDFENLWLSKLELLHKQQGPNEPIMLCLGDGQRLFTAERQYLTSVDAVHTLKHNCRNTKAIADFASTAGNVPALVFPDARPGELPTIMPSIADRHERSRAGAAIVNEWIAAGISPSRIAILSAYGVDSEYGSLNLFGDSLRQPITDDAPTWIAGQGVWCSTIRSFKGLEADCVVLVDLYQIHPQFFTRDDLYVAISRAKSRLVLFPSSQPMQRELKEFLPKEG